MIKDHGKLRYLWEDFQLEEKMLLYIPSISCLIVIRIEVSTSVFCTIIGGYSHLFTGKLQAKKKSNFKRIEVALNSEKVQ